MILNEKELRDRIYACWMGKNIGGTLGGPYEGRRELLNVTGFSTEPGEPLPNDDLDLQLVWLKALQERGEKGINPLVLGEYWMNYITPNWNEYGICKANMAAGYYPPLSGAMDNHWCDSNGAWIRSEIWACVMPGRPGDAVRYAFADACVDHGVGEGTYAEMFTTALESAAFVVKDIRQLIDLALTFIPEDCRLARCVQLVLDARDEGVDWVTARQRVLDDVLPDMGWFQAPANVAFVVIGLLYGDGDFKNSMLTALNCGDDTDCTCATLGSILGILYGTDVLPKDWMAYIGNRIATVAINKGEMLFTPDTIEDLTDQVLALAIRFSGRKPVSPYLKMKGVTETPGEVVISDKASNLNEGDLIWMSTYNPAKDLLSRKPYSYEIEFVHTRAVISFDQVPQTGIEGRLHFHILMENLMEEPSDPRRLEIEWLAPEGICVHGPRDIFINGRNTEDPGSGGADYEIEVSGNLHSMNRIYAIVTWRGRPAVGMIPVTFRGIV